jgi:hypothetical protein
MISQPDSYAHHLVQHRIALNSISGLSDGHMGWAAARTQGSDTHPSSSAVLLTH